MTILSAAPYPAKPEQSSSSGPYPMTLLAAIATALSTVVDVGTISIVIRSAVLRLRPGKQLQKAFRSAVNLAYAKVKQKARVGHYPSVSADLFDDTFLRNFSARFLEEYLSANDSSSVSAVLMKGWAEQLGPVAPVDPTADIELAMSDFLQFLEIELLKSDALRPMLVGWQLKSLNYTLMGVQSDIQQLTAQIANLPSMTSSQDGALPGSAQASASAPPFDGWRLSEPEHMLGREDDIDWLVHFLASSKRPRVAAITGMAGIGKTAVAASVTRLLNERGRFRDGVAVVLCHELRTPEQVLQRLLFRFDSASQALETIDLSRLTEQVRLCLDGRDALIVLDNVEPELAVDEVVLPLRAANVCVLLTARHSLPGSIVSRTAVRSLQLLPADTALELFFLSYADDSAHAQAQEIAAAQRIVSILERHTLAVKLAGAYARDLKRDLVALSKELEDLQRALDLPQNETPGAVRLAFESSVRAIASETRNLFSSLAVFASGEFGRQAALVVAGAIGLNAADASLDLLIRRGLLDSAINPQMPLGSDRERLHFHPLMQALASAELTELSQETQRRVKAALADHYAMYVHRVPDIGLVADEPNIMQAIAWIGEQADPDLATTIAWGMAAYWRDFWANDQAERYILWGLSAAEFMSTSKAAPLFRRAAANLLLALGQLRRSLGNLSGAEDTLTAARQIFKDLDDRKDEGVTLGALGQVAQARGNLGDAQRYHELSLQIAEETDDLREQGVNLFQLGALAQNRGELETARNYFQRALPIAQKVGDVRAEGAVHLALGELAASQGQYDEASTEYEIAMQLAEKSQNQRDQVITVASMGRLYMTMNEWKKARASLQDALTQLESPSDKRSVRHTVDKQGQGVILTNLGKVAAQEDDLANAEAYFQKAKEILSEAGAEYDQAAVTLELGRFLIQRRGDEKEGCKYLRESVRILQRLTHPDEAKVRSIAEELGCDCSNV